MIRRRPHQPPSIEVVECRVLLSAALAQINATEAQALAANVPQRPIIVAVLDTAVDVRDQRIASALWVNPGEIAGDGIDNDGNGFVDDINGWNFATDTAQIASGRASHGTNVALTVLSVYSGATILPVTVLDLSGGGKFSWATQGYAYLMGLESLGIDIEIVNASYAGGLCDPSIQAAISSDLWLTVAAAGNDGADYAQPWTVAPVYPSDYAGAVGVGALQPGTDSLASYSRKGVPQEGSTARFDGVEVTAPGSVRLIRPDGREYGFAGTSAAAALVSGAVALAASAEPEPPVPDALRDLLRDNSRPVDTYGKTVPARGSRWGVVDAAAMVRGALA